MSRQNSDQDAAQQQLPADITEPMHGQQQLPPYNIEQV